MNERETEAMQTALGEYLHTMNEPEEWRIGDLRRHWELAWAAARAFDVAKRKATAEGHGYGGYACNRCDGIGRIDNAPCETCQGQGWRAP